MNTLRHLGSPAMQTIERLAREQMTNTWKPLGEIINDLHWAENKKKAVKWDGSKWRPVPCPKDEGQYEAVARRRDAREGFDE